MKLRVLLGLIFLAIGSTHMAFSQGTDAGTTPTSLTVSLTGAANYDIPIALPPGIKDVVPSISLSFSSQAGNGLAGHGWNIGGLSTITRVPSTTYHDGEIDPVDFDKLDRFSLDGQRLLLKSGTYGANESVYQTENFSNLKIKAYAESVYGVSYGPRYFIVFYPNGTRAWYGNAGNSNGRLEWAIYKWQDPQGNFIRYTYGKYSDLLRITNIYYGSRAGTVSPNRIRFFYTNRTRSETSLVGDRTFERIKILNRIESYASGQLYRKYSLTLRTTNLGYQTVQSIQEANGVGGTMSPITFEYGKTTDQLNQVDGIPQALGYAVDSLNTRTIAGDFDGDGRMDVAFYEQNTRNELIVSNNLHDGNSGSNFGWALPTGRFDEVIATQSLDTSNKLMERQGITTVTDSYAGGLSSSVWFRTYAMDTDGSAAVQAAKKWEAPAYRAELNCDSDYFLKTSKKYISGDFNGDGLSDVIALTFPYTETFCNPSTDCDPDNPQQFAAAPGDCCECTNFPRTIAKSYFIDLDRTKTSNFSNYSGQIKRGITYNDPIFAADFDGDGKSELFHITNGKVEVYALGNDKILRVIHTENNPLIKKTVPVLPGDYNGDGKIDLVFPKEQFQEDWFFLLSNGISFNVYLKDIDIPFFPTRFGQVFLTENNYIPQDFNGDGKTDILRHSVTTALEGHEDDFLDEEEKLQLYVNSATTSNPSFSFSNEWSYENPGKNYGIPIFLEANSNNPNLEYAYISDDKIRSWEFTYDHRADIRMDKITNNGEVTSIFYEDIMVSPFTQNPGNVYYGDFEEVYPYVNINRAPGFSLVSALRHSGSGVTRRQDFKYQGAVSYAKGLGFLGFKQLYRTNWHGTGVIPLWNVGKYDPHLRGAPIQEWKANYLATTSSNYISNTDYEYASQLLPNKVFVNIMESSSLEDVLKGFTTMKDFEYDNFYNPLKITTTYGTKSIEETVDFTYFNNPNANNRNYHIGRPKSKIVSAKISGQIFTSFEEYTYQNNLVQTFKKRGESTPWLTETLTHNAFGNVLTKTLSAPNMAARTEVFGYDPSGRYVVTSIDIENLETTFAYDFARGNLLSISDPYDRSMGYTYDGWNRPMTETDYLGKTVTMTYTNTPDGGFEQLTDYSQGNDTRETYNALGWLMESSTLSLNGKWITTRSTYDAAGRRIRAYEPYFASESGSQYTSSDYDEWGRPISIILYTGEVQSITYDGLTATVDDGTKTVTTTTNPLGNVIEMTDPGGTVTYTYHGNRTMKTADYGGQVVETTIDAWGRKTQLIDPSAGTYTYTYNLYGELTEETTPKGTTIYKLDGVGKLTQKTVVGDDTDWIIDYSYNSDKLLSEITGDDQVNGRTYAYSYDYDDFNRPNRVTETNPFAHFEYDTTYDDFGRPWRQTYIGQNLTDGTNVNLRTRNSYDADSGMLEEMHDDRNNQRLWRLNAHDARGQVTRTVLGNGFRQNRNYDTYGLPKTVRDVKGSGSTQQRALRMNYTFDAQRGVLDSRRNIDLNWTEDFGYDNLDRLTTITGAVQKTQDYDYRGRITNNTAIGAYNYGQGKIYQLAGLDLNNNGAEFYRDRERREIAYNAFKKPVDIFEEGQGRVSFGYNPMLSRSHAWYGGTEEDADQRRFRKHYSAIVPMEIIEDKQTNNTKIITYIGGDPYSATVAHIETTDDSDDDYHYLHRDYLDSILAITDAAGTIKEQRQFGAWGEVDRFVDDAGITAFGYDSILGRGYTGHEHFFSIGLIHMNGRMYDAQVGKFLSPDNYVQDPYNTQNFDRYGYVLNNPLSYSDPSGEEGIALLIGAAIAVIVNGIANSVNGQSFFKGSFGSAIMGAWGGGISSAIGGAASGIGTGLSTTGQTIAQASFQAGAHALLGGAMSAAHGNNFWAGALSGLAGSAIGSAAGTFVGDAGGFWRGAGTVAAGGVAGGISSSLAGGSFWDGVRNGVITAALNHVAHRIQNSLMPYPIDYEEYFKREGARIDGFLENGGFSNAQQVLGIGSLTYGTGELLVYNRAWGYWLGNNGKFNSTRWGGNQYTGNRAGALRSARLWKLGGKAVFGLGAAMSFYEGANHLSNGNYGGLGRSGLDIVMARVGFMGPWGALTSGTYFLGTWATDNGYISHSPYKRNWNNTCFVAGTEILLPNGKTKKIENIEVGDEILSVNMTTMKIENDSVRIVPNKIEKYRKIFMQYDNGNENVSSPHHPFYVKDKGWCVFDVEMAKKDLSFEVGHLELGDIVFYYDEGVLKETKIVKIEDQKEEAQMYNIKYVKSNNTFFANGVLVHNRFVN